MTLRFFTVLLKSVLFILIFHGLSVADNYYQIDRFSTGIERRIPIDSISKLAPRDDTLCLYSKTGEMIINLMDSLSWTNYYRPVPAAPLLAEPADGAGNVSADFAFCWHPVDSCASYRIEISADSVFADLISGDTALTDTLWRAHGLAYRAEYYWRARGDNFATSGEWSAVRSFVTGGPEIKLTQPVLTRSASDSSVTLGWRTEVPAVCSLAWRPIAGGEWQSLRIKGNPRFRMEQTVAGLSPRTEYEGRLILCLDDTTCMDSAIVFAFETMAPRVAKVFPLVGKPAFSYIGSREATITFATDVALCAGAALYAQADSFQPLSSLLDTTAALEHRFRFESLFSGESYFVRLGIIDDLSETLTEMPTPIPSAHMRRQTASRR